MECKTNKDYCTNSTCTLSFKSRLVKQLTWSCDLNQPVDDVHSQVTLYYRYRAGYKKFLVDLNIDVCAYHGNHLGNAVMDLIADVYQNYTTNIWHPCPFVPGHLAVTKLPLTASLLKNIFLPAGEYKLVLDIKVGKEMVPGILIKLFFDIPAGRTLEDDKMG